MDTSVHGTIQKRVLVSGCVGDESSAPLFSLSLFSFSYFVCPSLFYECLPGSCRSQAVCSSNRLDLSTDSGAASVLSSAHASPFTLACGLVGVGDVLSATRPGAATLTGWLQDAPMPFECYIFNFKSVFSLHSPLALSAHVAFNHRRGDKGGSCSTTNSLHNTALMHRGKLNNA